MHFNNSFRHSSLRKPEYDYASPGHYFVTICTHRMNILFSVISSGEMILNNFGKIVSKEWLRTAEIRRGVILDKYVVMPNHFHAIIVFQEDKVHSPLSRVIAQFKSVVTKQINILRNSADPVWQRNFYDHIIRNERTLNLIRLYIETNPILWRYDPNNSEAIRSKESIENVFREKYGLDKDDLDFIVNYVMYRMERPKSK